MRFKAISGKEDQAGGVVVRLTDRNNYYIARANALENNVHFFRVVGGRRQELAGANTKVASGVWHTLALRAEGNRFPGRRQSEAYQHNTIRRMRGMMHQPRQRDLGCRSPHKGFKNLSV